MWSSANQQHQSFLWRVYDVVVRLRGLRATASRQLDIWGQRASERAHLSQMVERDLADLGISRVTAIAEARKPFWRE